MLKNILKISAVFILTASITMLMTAKTAPINFVNAENENNKVVATTNVTSAELVATTTRSLDRSIENTAIINPSVTSSNPNLYISLVIACAILLIGAAAQGRQIR